MLRLTLLYLVAILAGFLSGSEGLRGWVIRLIFATARPSEWHPLTKSLSNSCSKAWWLVVAGFPKWAWIAIVFGGMLVWLVAILQKASAFNAGRVHFLRLHHVLICLSALFACSAAGWQTTSIVIMREIQDDKLKESEYLKGAIEFAREGTINSIPGGFMPVFAFFIFMCLLIFRVRDLWNGGVKNMASSSVLTHSKQDTEGKQ